MIQRVTIELPLLPMLSGWAPFKEPDREADRDYRDHIPNVDGIVRDSFTPKRSELSAGSSS